MTVGKRSAEMLGHRLGAAAWVFASALCAAVAAAGGPAKPWSFSSATLEPFWTSGTMEGESALFIQDHAASVPKASLLFAPTKIVKVCSSSGEVVYAEGRDYVWKPGAKEISLPAGTRIPFKTPQELRRPARSQPYALTHRDGQGEILFGAGHEYHDLQTLITYTHDPSAWAGPAPSFAGDRLPRTLKKLTGRQPVTIALLGDSISTGCNASGWAKTPPFQPAYQDLFALHLESVYGGKVSLKNFAVGGTDTAWGLQTIDKIVEARPDLVILAFGMNDAAGRPAAQYQANIQGMIDAVRKAQPDAEFILVATMLGNRDWTVLRQELFPQYRDALARLCGPGIALADMTSLWAELLKHKKDWDLTGNGVNHPNDFGHRVYAQVLSALLIRNAKASR
jgi:acyl-CoA thioesterase I